MKKGIRVIISGGGTGGHIFPAISIANALKELSPDCEILFVGALGRMEMERVPAAGYKIKGLPVAGLQRSFSTENFKLPFKILRSLRMAGSIIDNFKPDAAVGVGGYASGPLLWMAGRKSVPYIIQEQNSYAGLTNKLLGKRAKKVCVAYEGMEKFFRKEKIIITGNPVRKGIIKATPEMKERAAQHFSLDRSKKTLLITGGSLGAGTLNRCMTEWITANIKCDVNIIWQTGKYYYNNIKVFNEQNPRNYIRCYEFLSDMDLALAAADVVISRAGAGTISELCIAAKAVIFVPSPNVAEDHQTHNARSLSDKGAALLVPDEYAQKELMKTAMNLIKEDSRINELEIKIEEMALRDSAEIIAREIIKASSL